MNKDYDTLIQSLSETIADYRQNEIAPATPLHIEKWLHQFDLADQLVILTEMDTIMRRFYFSKNLVKEHLRSFLKNRLIGNSDPRDVLHHTGFLCVQQDGSSQRAMLDIIDEVLQEEYKFPLAIAGIKEIQTYVYIDDAVYTGNRLRYDLTDGTSTVGWFSNGPANCTLLIYTIAFHVDARDYVCKKIQAIAGRKQIKLKMFTALSIENRHSPESHIEVLWPKRVINDPIVDSYIAEMSTSSGRKIEMDTLFQNDGQRGQEKLFSSPQAREIVERAFLTKGLQLVRASQNSAPSMRPLGFMKLTSLGFGTFFVTYRNIANNCPLVLWWGDPNLPSTHPLGKWYPLFPRRTNIKRVIMTEEQIFDDQPF
jgi:hypothetical protein